MGRRDAVGIRTSECVFKVCVNLREYRPFIIIVLLNTSVMTISIENKPAGHLP